MLKELNVLIIGAGNIGAFFDNPDTTGVLTHAHAFLKSKGFKIKGFVDADIERSKTASAIWGGQAFVSIKDAFKNADIDIVSVCVPDEQHYDTLKSIADYSVKLVFIEKPLCKTLRQAKEIIDLYEKKGIKTVMNYSRRFIPEFQRLHEKIQSGVYGHLITGTGYYGKGILHNGSHLVDFLRYLIGEIIYYKANRKVYDFYSDDPSIDAMLEFEGNGEFNLHVIDCRKYTAFEIELFFDKRRVRILDSGFKIEEYEVTESKHFKGYNSLSLVSEKSTSFGNYMLYAVEEIYRCLESEMEPRCTIYDGYKAMEICLQLHKDECIK